MELANCLVCKRQYPKVEEKCPQCGALQGQNFVMADPSAVPPAPTTSAQSAESELGWFFSTLLLILVFPLTWVAGIALIIYLMGYPTISVVFLALGSFSMLFGDFG